jgi:transaldolase
MTESSIERLAKTHPDLEIWWDSSPLVYDQWVQARLAAAARSGDPPWKNNFTAFTTPASRPAVWCAAVLRTRPVADRGQK